MASNISYSQYKPTIGGKPVQGPGFGWNNDLAYSDSKTGKFLGVKNLSKGSGRRSSGGGSSSSSNNSVSSATKKLQSQIGGGWDSYISGLNSQLSGLNDQRAAQEGLVTAQYGQGLNTLGLQKQQGIQSLEGNRRSATQNQVNNLRDIASNIRNAFQAGNVYLGTRGASDSSAAPQYSYALNKMGTQQRSGVMNNTANIMADIDTRQSNLENIYNTEVNNLEERKRAGMLQIAQWFAGAQNQIRQMQAEGKLNKAKDLANLSRDLLNQAISKANMLEQYNAQNRQALDAWAGDESSRIADASGNLQGAYDVNYDMPQYEQQDTTPIFQDTVNNLSYGGGFGRNNEKDRNNLFSGGYFS